MGRRKEAPVASVYMTQSGYGGMAHSHDGRFTLSAMDCDIKAHDTRFVVKQEPWWVTNPGEPVVYDVPAADLHDKFITDIALSPDDKTFATSSEDGFIRLFTAVVVPEDPNESGNELTVDTELIQACARFGGPARAVAFSPTGSWLAAAGDEPGILKLIMVSQPSTVNIMRVGPTSPGFQPVAQMDYDPKSDFVATVAPNGVCGVWSVDSGAFTELEINSRRALCVAWSPSGDQLLVGTHKGTVLVNRSTWAFARVLEEFGGDDDEELVASPDDLHVTAVSWSANGRYALTARKDITLWDVANSRVVSSWMSDGIALALHWHRNVNGFMVLDNIGQFGIVNDAVPDHLPLPNGKTGGLKLPNVPSGSSGDSSASSSCDDSTSGTDSGSDDEDLAVCKSRNKRTTKGTNKPAPEDRDKLFNLSEGSGCRNQLEFNTEDLDADEEEDAIELRRQREEEAQLDALAQHEAEYSRQRRKEKRRKHRETGKTRGATADTIPNPQPSFVPSSTPESVVGIPSDSNGSSTKMRILCWNLTATVVSFNEESHNIVEVEFADSNRRVFGIKDHFGFRLGCVNETGILLACRKNKEHGSIVSFRPFRSWSGNSEWTQPLATDESALTLALGGRFAAVATDQNVVRIFSLSGLQVYTFGMPGRIVTMAAVEDRLAIVYAPSRYLPELRFDLLQLANSGVAETVIASDLLVLSPQSNLEWFGFTTDTAELVSYDSTGSLWLQPCNRGGSRWLPMLRGAGKLADCDWFWVASVSAESVNGAQCFSNERFPPAKPRPALRTLPLMAPVVEPLSKTGQSTLEERLFRSQLRLRRLTAAKEAAEEIFNSDDDEMDEAESAVNTVAREVDKCLLGLMEVAARSEQGLRAFDLATRLSSSIGLKYAISLANHYKRGSLASRIEQLAMRQLATEEEEKLEKESTRKLLRLQATVAHRGSPVTPVPISNSDGMTAHGNSKLDGVQESRSVVDAGEQNEIEGSSDADVDALVARRPVSIQAKKVRPKLPYENAGNSISKVEQSAGKRKVARTTVRNSVNRFAKRVKR